MTLIEMLCERRELGKVSQTRNLPFGENGEAKGKGGVSPGLHKRSAEGWGGTCPASGGRAP